MKGLTGRNFKLKQNVNIDVTHIMFSYNTGILKAVFQQRFAVMLSYMVTDLR